MDVGALALGIIAFVINRPAYAVELRLDRIEVLKSGGVAGHAVLFRPPSPNDSEILEIPNAGLPWLPGNFTVDFIGLPEELRGDPIVLSYQYALREIQLRPGQKISGIVDLSSYFDHAVVLKLIDSGDFPEGISASISSDLLYYGAPEWRLRLTNSAQLWRRSIRSNRCPIRIAVPQN